MNFLVFLPWLFFFLVFLGQQYGCLWVFRIGFYLVGVSVMQCYMKLHFWFFLGIPCHLVWELSRLLFSFGLFTFSSSSCKVTTF